ncbi:MAG: ThuA domain-containing protein [Kiritimatiellia bacterium]|jgi:type 1 glutamine amidotransferase/HEAT repeat protein|nr:ThuA domain-containing protein [Kiritimatiellia bacterium]
MREHNGFRRALLIVCAISGAALAVPAQTLTPVPQADAERIGELVETWVPARSSRSRRILVFWRCEGFVHGRAIEYGNRALEIAAARTRAFTADFAREYEALTPERLARYDALVLNNTTALDTRQHRFLEPALTEFVRSGKGLAVIHAGADNFYHAEQAAEMVGGRFWGHPWGGGGMWAFNVDEPDHPLNRAFGGRGFLFGDEIYQQQSPFYNRAKLRVLVSLDLSHAATAAAAGQRRADNDYAVSWIRPYGRGRVFYTSFGHDQRAFLDRATLTHLLDGVQYALGDLRADDTPSGLRAADLARVRAATDLTAAEVAHALQDILTRTGHPAADAANRAMLNGLLKENGVSPHGRQAVLRALAAAGAPVPVDALTACLAIPETREAAGTLLAATPGKAASRALSRAVPVAGPELRCALLNALALRREAAAIAPYAADAEERVAAAALAGLGRIGDKTALAALQNPVRPALEPVRLTALAACLGTLAEQGGQRAAARAARPLFANAGTPSPVRAAAARVLLRADRGFFAEGMADACPQVRQTLVRAADRVPLRKLAAALETAAPADQVALLAKLAERGARAYAGDVAAKLAGDQEAVVAAALRALGSLGGRGEVPAMAAFLTREGAAGQAAREALLAMRAPGAGAALLEWAGDDPAVQARVLPLLGERGEVALLPRIKPLLRSERAEVRKEAWKTLGLLADRQAYATLLAELRSLQAEERVQAEAALQAAGKRAGPAARAVALLDAWEGEALGVPARNALIALMSVYRDPAFVAPLATALKEKDAGVREAALRALADWTDMRPYPVLKEAVSAQPDARLRHVALRGAVKLVSAHAGAEARGRFLDLLRTAPDDKGRESVAEAMFLRDGLGLFPVLQTLFDDAACGPSAKRLYLRFYDGKVKPRADQAQREIAPSLWRANASHGAADAAKAFDRKPETRWSSNCASEKGMWFTLDLGENLCVSQVVLDTARSGSDTPNGFEVLISNDGKTWQGPVAKGDGTQRGKTVIPMLAQGRHLKIVTTGGRPGKHWSIHEIQVTAGFDPKKAAEIRQVAGSLR